MHRKIKDLFEQLGLPDQGLGEREGVRGNFKYL
jgi:hypothetical protein